MPWSHHTAKRRVKGREEGTSNKKLRRTKIDYNHKVSITN